MQDDPTPLDSAATVATLAALYEAAGPRLGCRLVEANAVLLVAGLRGYADFSVDAPIDADLEALERMQPALAAAGLRWVVIPELRSDPFGRPYWSGFLNSLPGYAHVSRSSHLLEMAPFEPATDWLGWRIWQHYTYAALGMAYPKHQETVWTGISLGYPDQAILDFCAAMDADTKGQLEPVSIPAIERYVCAQPRFHYAPKHANEPGIATTRATWQALLYAVYESDWHQRLAADLSFQDARQPIDTREIFRIL